MNLSLTGIVEQGNGDGRKLGFPTANLRLFAPLLLEHGVYAAWIEIDGKKHTSVLHYGPRLVFNETHPLFEVHILDFEENIYGKTATVTVTHFIRGTMNFDSLDALVEQMKKDKKQARDLLDEAHH